MVDALPSSVRPETEHNATAQQLLVENTAAQRINVYVSVMRKHAQCLEGNVPRLRHDRAVIT